MEVVMQRCLDLASQGGKKVRPNPNVGAVLVHGNKIIGEGYHAFFGGPHAEVNCLENVKPENRHLISQSTLYVSLEPCNSYGKTPACTNLILHHKIPEVIISTTDPNPSVNGQGLEILRKHGVRVITHILEEQGKHLIRYFYANQIQHRPYVILKTVKSSDGYIGKKGEKIWLSNPISSVLSHKWRSEVDGILVGTNTAMADNPKLDNRYFPGESPVRIILDRLHKIPASFHLKNGRQQTFIISETPVDIGLNTETIRMNFDTPGFIGELLSQLFQRNIFVLLVEGGSELIHSFLKTGLWDEARVITTPHDLSSGIKAPNFTGRLWEKKVLDGDEYQLILKE